MARFEAVTAWFFNSLALVLVAVAILIVPADAFVPFPCARVGEHQWVNAPR